MICVQPFSSPLLALSSWSLGRLCSVVAMSLHDPHNATIILNQLYVQQTACRNCTWCGVCKRARAHFSTLSLSLETPVFAALPFTGSSSTCTVAVSASGTQVQILESDSMFSDAMNFASTYVFILPYHFIVISRWIRNFLCFNISNSSDRPSPPSVEYMALYKPP